MSEALRQGRSALIQAIEHALDGLDAQVGTEFGERDALWQAKLDKLGAEADETRRGLEAKIEQLQSRVAALTSDLENTQAARAADAANAAAARPDGSGSGDAPKNVKDTKDTKDELAPDTADLQKSLDKSRMRYEFVREKLDAAVAVAQKRKAETLGWVKYADSLELKIKKLEKRRAAGRQPVAVTGTSSDAADLAAKSGALPPTLPTDIPPTPVTIEKAAPTVQKPILGASFSLAMSSFLGTPSPGQHEDEPELPSRAPATQPDGDPENNTAVESTQGEPSSQPQLPTPRATSSDRNDEPTVVKKEPSSDGPEIVWERPAKKARRDDADIGRETKSAQEAQPAMKLESSGSSTWTGMGRFRESQESTDLDQGQLAVATPRKRHLVFPALPLSSEGDSRQSSERSNAASFAAASVPPLVTEPVAPTPVPHPLPPATPLAPVSVNVRRGSARDPAKAMKQLKRGIGSLAEDNQGYSTPTGVPRADAARPLPGTTRSTRLNSLLNSRPPEPSPVSSLARSNTPAGQRNRDINSPISGLFGQPPPTRILPHQRGGERSTPRTLSTAGRAARDMRRPTAKTTPPPSTVRSFETELQAARVEASSFSGKPTAVPLRRQPVEKLRLEDFKINAAKNNGETFAYSEVVRGRADRASLAGCTDPQCCGKAFRAMAASELDAAGLGHFGRPDSVVLMERHLGDEAFVLARMTPDEKRALWLEARTKELADKYGKHRHRFYRRASPPGFWDTDFPSTQEEAQNRVEAERVIRATIQERHREAMQQGGGRWLFRDE